MFISVNILGHPKDNYDLFIAATPIYDNLLLITRNRKDYERIPKLKFSPPAASGSFRTSAIIIPIHFLLTRRSNSRVTGLVRSRCIVGGEHGTNDETGVP